MHWHPDARRVSSPNCDERPAGQPPELIVIHSISLPPCAFGGPYIDQLFGNRLDPDDHPYFQGIHALRVSAHLLIRRDGELVQYVPFDRRAWHAGVSSYRGRERVNDFSIGIELEGCDSHPFEEVQYERLLAVLGWLRERYPTIAADAVTGHADIAPGRKCDPGPHFDWQRLRS